MDLDWTGSSQLNPFHTLNSLPAVSGILCRKTGPRSPGRRRLCDLPRLAGAGHARCPDGPVLPGDPVARGVIFSKWLWVLDCRGAAVRGAKAPIVSKKN